MSDSRPLDTWDAMRSRSWDPMPQDDLPNLLSALGTGGDPPAQQRDKVRQWLESPAAAPAPAFLKKAASRFAGVKDAA